MQDNTIATRYALAASNRFAALSQLPDDDDVDSAWNTVKDTITASANDSVPNTEVCLEETVVYQRLIVTRLLPYRLKGIFRVRLEDFYSYIAGGSGHV